MSSDWNREGSRDMDDHPTSSRSRATGQPSSPSRPYHVSGPSSPHAPVRTRITAHPSRSTTRHHDTDTTYTPIPVHLALTTQSLSRLGMSDRPTSSSPASPAAHSRPYQLSSRSPHLSESPYGHGQRRLISAASSTSVSESEADDGPSERRSKEVEVEQAKGWLQQTRSNKGKGKMIEPEGVAGRLPPEVLIQILHLLNTKGLLSSLLVSRSWCACAFSILWSKPSLPKITTLASLVRVLGRPQPSLPYHNAVRRLHLSQLSSTLTDELFLGLSPCSRLERLTLTRCSHLSAKALITVLQEMPQLLSVDLGGIEAVDDDVVETLAATCKHLQAVNLTGCKAVGDQGILALAKHNKLLRRAKFTSCHRITERSLIPFVQSCNLILELELKDAFITDAVVHSIFLHCTYLRDLRLNGCTELTEECIPNLPALSGMTDDQILHSAQSVKLQCDDMSRLRAAAATMDCLRTVDLTECINIGDKTVKNLIANAPKLRHLTLAKCINLTDKSLKAIEKLEWHLHHLHMGHVKGITDVGISRVAKACNRIRYLDLGCCDNLTDAGLREFGNMPKLRRVGLVKLVKITDDTIYNLVEQFSSLERIHLSYCENLTVKAITFLLNQCMQLKNVSLTGISAFRKREFRQFCREPPENFTQHQRRTFCVFSNDKLDQLRRYLNESYLSSSGVETDETSTRRGSGSSTSSVTVPGDPSPPPPSVGGHSHTGNVYRRGSAPTLRNHGLAVPGLPSNVFVSASPNFLAPARAPRAQMVETFRDPWPYHRDRNGRPSDPPTAGIPARVREAQDRLRDLAQTDSTSGVSSRSGGADSRDPNSRAHRSGTWRYTLADQIHAMGGPDRRGLAPPAEDSGHRMRVRDRDEVRDRERPNGPRANPLSPGDRTSATRPSGLEFSSSSTVRGYVPERERRRTRQTASDAGGSGEPEQGNDREPRMPGSFAWNTPSSEGSARGQRRDDGVLSRTSPNRGSSARSEASSGANDTSTPTAGPTSPTGRLRWITGWRNGHQSQVRER